MFEKNTKIICTLGPASEDIHTIEKMVRAGMNVVRLNFSHGTYEQFEKLIKNVREISRKLNTPIAIMQDLQGPKIRIGTLPQEGVEIKKGETVILTTRPEIGRKGLIPIQYKKLPKEVKEGHMILIDDGLIELEVKRTRSNTIFCKVITGGTIKTHKGINVPGADLSVSTITEKDKRDLKFALRLGIDYVALSFVKSGKDIVELKKLIKKYPGDAKVIAKIERQEAVKNLEGIIRVADAIMVARGDLGIEIPAEMVPIVQKKIIEHSNLHGKPVITATQILQSMVESPRATRAEISDAANAVFDHTDALMLSNESAVGKYPVEAVETLSKVAATVEAAIQKEEFLLPHKIRKFDLPISNATCLNAAKLALDINANMIVAVTGSGFTAKHIAKHRLYKPIITLTDSEKVKHQLALVWGLNHIFVKKLDLKHAAQEVRKFLKHKQLVKKGDEVVIVVNASKKEKLISTIII